MADNNLLINSLRGGLNESEPAFAIADNQCSVASNVEWVNSMLGERRRGTTPIDLEATLSAHERIWWLFQGQPTESITDSELWALGVTGTADYALFRKTSAWQAQVMPDDPWLMGSGDYPTSRWDAANFHGKVFMCYPTTVDQMHVWDGTQLRRAGLSAPTDVIPYIAHTISTDPYHGGILKLRYYRFRWLYMDGDDILLRSEPSEAESFQPDGTSAGIELNLDGNEADFMTDGELTPTHWEAEGSFDGVNFYIIDRDVVSSSIVDDVPDSSSYVTAGFELSADIGDYTVMRNARFVLVDEDRLIMIGHWTDPELAARMWWTPVHGATGVGNAERIELDTDPFIDLDTSDSGELAGVARCFADIFVFFTNRVYRLRRTGVRTAAYEVVEEKAFGAVAGSIVVGTDSKGDNCVYFFDPQRGPCRYTEDDVMPCGHDVASSASRINLDAALPCVAYYYPQNRQVIWNIALSDYDIGGGETTATDIPHLGLVLHTRYTVDASSGVRGGWSTWTGKRVRCLSQCLFSSNVDDDTFRSRHQVPFIGVEEAGLSGVGILHMTDTGFEDDELAYPATLRTKAFVPRDFIGKIGIMCGAISVNSDEAGVVSVWLIRDLGAEQTTVQNITTTTSETIVPIDNLYISDAKAVQIAFQDSDYETRWRVNVFSGKLRNEENM